MLGSILREKTTFHDYFPVSTYPYLTKNRWTVKAWDGVVWGEVLWECKARKGEERRGERRKQEKRPVTDWFQNMDKIKEVSLKFCFLVTIFLTDPLKT